MFGPPDAAATINAQEGGTADITPAVTVDNAEIYFASRRGTADTNIWRAGITPTGFAPPTLVTELNSPALDRFPVISSDRLTVYFASDRPGGGIQGNLNVWTARRASVSDAFGTPLPVDELNTANSGIASWISADNCRLYGLGSYSGATAFVMATRDRK
jgi:hypothetical protein